MIILHHITIILSLRQFISPMLSCFLSDSRCSRPGTRRRTWCARPLLRHFVGSNGALPRYERLGSDLALGSDKIWQDVTRAIGSRDVNRHSGMVLDGCWLEISCHLQQSVKVLSGPLSSFPIESIEKSKSTIIDSGSQYMSNPVLFLSEARVRMLLGLHRLSFSELHGTLWDNLRISMLALRWRNLAPGHGGELCHE